MHKLNMNMHKSSSLITKKERDDYPFIEDAERQDRLAKVLLYHSKGFTRSEITRKLNVNQSTVSRDLIEIKKKAREFH